MAKRRTQADYWTKMQVFMCKYCGESANNEYTESDFVKLGKGINALKKKTTNASYENSFLADLDILNTEKEALHKKEKEDERSEYLARLSETKSKWPGHELPVFLSLDVDAERDLYKYHIEYFRYMKRNYDPHCANEMQ